MVKVNKPKFTKKDEIYLVWRLGQIGSEMGLETDIYFSEHSFMNLSRNNICVFYREPEKWFHATEKEEQPPKSFLETYVEATAGDDPGTFRLSWAAYISYYDAKREEVMRIAEKKFVGDKQIFKMEDLDELVKKAIEETKIELFDDYIRY